MAFGPTTLIFISTLIGVSMSVDPFLSLELDLLKDLSGDNDLDSVAISSISATSSIALAYAGAGGETKKEFDKRLLGNASDNVHEVLKAKFSSISGKTEKYSFEIASKAFIDESVKVKPLYLQTLAKYYGSDVGKLSFKNISSSVEEINKFVGEKTHGRISDLVNEQSIDGNTRLFLANALYFKAAFETPFKKSNTQVKPFYVKAGIEKEVPTMYVASRYFYKKFEQVEVLHIPYVGKAKLVLVLPIERFGLDQVLNQLNSTALESFFKVAQKRSVGVYLPHFKIETSSSLKGVFKRLGFETGFSTSADFSQISDEGLQISDIVQKVYFSTDESGTEAAAASGVVVSNKRSEISPIVLSFDHPFLFFVLARDQVLFSGAVRSFDA